MPPLAFVLQTLGDIKFARQQQRVDWLWAWLCSELN